jgi:hypothetical protein
MTGELGLLMVEKSASYGDLGSSFRRRAAPGGQLPAPVSLPTGRRPRGRVKIDCDNPKLIWEGISMLLGFAEMSSKSSENFDVH